MPSLHRPLTRRAVLAAAAASPWLLHTRGTRAEESPLRIGQSTALSGPLGDLGQAIARNRPGDATA